MSWSNAAPAGQKLDIIIIGGSLAGLLHGIMIKSLGHNVRILERNQTNERVDHGAGLGIGDKGVEFLEQYDSTGLPLGYDSPRIRYLGELGETIKEVSVSSRLHLTSWSAYHYRLRALFDGHASGYCKNPPAIPNSHGKAIFELDRNVTKVSESNSDSNKLSVEYESLEGRSSGSYAADLVLDAGGPFSVVRNNLLEKVEYPFVGVVAWRALIDENAVSENARSIFDDVGNIAIGDNNYCVGYRVPGRTGKLGHGEGLLNAVWYIPILEGSKEYKNLMTDRNGIRHKNTLTRGAMAPETLEKYRGLAKHQLEPRFREIILTDNEPFVSTVREVQATRISFFDGRLLLVGDAANLMRPNGGRASHQAALQCLLLRDVFEGKLTVDDWQEKLLREGAAMAAFGKQFSENLLPSLKSSRL